METIANSLKTLSREERFWELYKCAFTGLHAQFDRMLWCDNEGDVHIDWHAFGNEFPERSKRLVKVAWNFARAACELFDEATELEEFNEKC